MQNWGNTHIFLSLDTTMLFNKWCVICVSLVYRRRAIPLSWRIIEHSSAGVGSREIYPILASVQNFLMQLPELESVCINADRGFCDQELMDDFTAHGWHWNIRGKGQIYISDADGHVIGKFRQLLSQHGQLVIQNSVYLTAQHYSPVNVAAVWPFGCDEPCSLKTFSEYHERFQIEEGFLDLKSGAFNLERTRLDSAPQLENLLFLIGLTDLFLLSEGTAFVATGQRRKVDTHWMRGLSYVQIGWRSIQRALTQRIPFLEQLCLSSAPDPEPSRRRSCPLYLYLNRGFS